MTVTSRVPALIDYLIALFTAAPTLGAATPKVTVFDGPPITGLDAPLKLYVGVTDPTVKTGEQAAKFAQEWGGLGRLARNETTTIHCAAEAWNGTGALQPLRVAAFGILAAVETLMQADSTQFGGNVLFPAPGVAEGSLVQYANTGGVAARVPFDLIFKSRIGG